VVVLTVNHNFEKERREEVREIARFFRSSSYNHVINDAFSERPFSGKMLRTPTDITKTREKMASQHSDHKVELQTSLHQPSATRL
jgi:hypothetical protein